ncbi:MAG TPA: metallophosphoesterase, partial [Pilimelia sp.]|nr:metallophosphoesterase [Pilimelia sp.]
RIAVVSDIHLGPINGRAHTVRIVDAINRLGADAVAIVGDLVDGTVAELGPAAAPLRGLRSRHGTFFVTGNHEFFSGVVPWLEELPRLGVRVLANERLPIDGLDLAGVHDLAGGEPQGFGPHDVPMGPDFAATFAGRDPARPVVLLAHQPVQAREAARYGVDLQLSGHTHGGQMAPFNLLVALEQPVVSGLGDVDGTQVYVTNGAGFWGPPVRVGAPPQVSLVQLRATG